MVFEIFFLFSLLWLSWIYLSTYSVRRNFPKGPFPLPLIGNMHQVGLDIPFSMENLRKKYGDIYTITIPIGTFVIINTAELMHEALVTRKDDFSGRVDESQFPYYLIVEDKDVGFTNYSSAYVFRRKVFSNALHVFGEGKNLAKGRLYGASEKLVQRVSETNDKPFSLKEYLGKTTMMILCEWLVGKQYDYEDPMLGSLLEFNEQFAAVIRPGSAHHFFPWLRFLPTSFMDSLNYVISTRDEFCGKQLSYHLETYRDGVIRDITDAFIAQYEQEMEKKENARSSVSKEDIKFLMMNVLFAAHDTNNAISTWFILYIMLYRSVQENIHEELDRIVGKEKQPELQDIENLPYLQATICEVIRHAASIALIMRRAVCDTKIRDYSIPKGTTIIINLWRIHSDPAKWKEPSRFHPPRFLNSEGQFVGWKSEFDFFPFSIGRRACPGITLGKMNLVIILSRLLHSFRFEVPEGEPKPSLEAVTSSVRFPKPYNVKAIRRI